jgi:glycosyltransferase involved in cell wall biosynthesis
MPVYNGEAYLNEAIESVLNQTYTEFEFLIINDGSTDNTQKIIESYKDQRIKCIYQDTAGVASALNKGISMAKGEYIWRHDADDKCLPEQLENQLNFLEVYKNYALVSTQIAFMTDRGKIAYDYKQPKDTYFNNSDFVKVERDQFNPYSPITHATVLMKKSIFDTVEVYRTDFKTSEDTDLWLRIIEHFNAAVMNYCSYFVRLNSTSATQIHKKTNNFYRDLAFAYADERATAGSDPLQRGETIPRPEKDETQQIVTQPVGKNFRADILNFRYLIDSNAKDYKNIFRDMRLALKDGWRLKQTWKALLFPLLGEKFVRFGVKVKQKVKN